MTYWARLLQAKRTIIREEITMTAQTQLDTERALNVLLAAAAEFARLTIGSHDKATEIADRFGENLVLGVDLGRGSVAPSGP